MTGDEDRRRPLWVDLLLLSLCLAVFLSLIGLGNWQLRRLEWKTALIEAVDTRAYGNSVPAPTTPVRAETHAYLRVAVSGRFQHERSQRVKAVTELGPGHWLMTPLTAEDGIFWVNRGFLPAGLQDTARTEPHGQVTVTGLLRIAEPGGTFLERNRPDQKRWVSRDVEAMSRTAGIRGAAPYFIDADHTGTQGTWPRGGLTVVTFRNNHLSYALTWYAMAVLLLTGMIYVVIERLRSRSPKAISLAD
ncbi:MAG: SURF1 family protein [Pseudomonadota bacterium]